jgi:cysteinyl-tRNA synthetase
MSGDILGDHFDIHTGGIDHLTIHHENEIAQNDCAFGHRVVERWMHNEFVLVDGGKMSKSLNNIYTIDQLEEMGYEPLAYKFFCLNTSYSKKINFTFDGLKSAQSALVNLRKILQEHKNGNNKIAVDTLEKYKKEFLDAINNDLNTPLAIGVLFGMVKNEPKSSQVYDLALEFDRALGVGLDRVTEEKSAEIPEDIVNLAELRWQAKQNKDWASADKYRAEILEKGFVILDAKDGYKIEKK